MYGISAFQRKRRSKLLPTILMALSAHFKQKAEEMSMFGRDMK